MMLSQDAAMVLVDLIENKLSVMNVDDRDDLREMITLKRCLAELKGIDPASQNGLLKSFEGVEIPRRGRHRKVSDILEAHEGKGAA